MNGKRIFICKIGSVTALLNGRGAARAGGAEFRSVQTVYTVYRILYTQLTSALLLTIGIA